MQPGIVARFNNLLAAASGDASGNAILAIDMEFPGFLRQARDHTRRSKYLTSLLAGVNIHISYIHIYTTSSICIYTHTRMYKHKHIYIYIHIHIHTHTYSHIYICT